MFLLLSAGMAFQKERTQPKMKNLHFYMLQYNEGPSPTSKPVSQTNETALHSVASWREKTVEHKRYTKGSGAQILRASHSGN